MAYDAKLDARIRAALGGWDGVTSRKMFGGVCHLHEGNMVAGVWKEFLILRLGEDAADFARELPHVRPFDITGHPMKGWVMVEPAGVRTAAQLKKWLGQARAFVETLPPK
ncbi:MAG TPA: TfoX/Sxy family protein [Candidatus Methanoperedens sp.]|nr:TfoX/Sxy family protein [Candidatus Methanoperedens sp.]